MAPTFSSDRTRLPLGARPGPPCGSEGPVSTSSFSDVAPARLPSTSNVYLSVAAAAAPGAGMRGRGVGEHLELQRRRAGAVAFGLERVLLRRRRGGAGGEARAVLRRGERRAAGGLELHGLEHRPAHGLLVGGKLAGE